MSDERYRHTRRRHAATNDKTQAISICRRQIAQITPALSADLQASCGVYWMHEREPRGLAERQRRPGPDEPRAVDEVKRFDSVNCSA